MTKQPNTTPGTPDPAARGSGHEPSDAVQRLRKAMQAERLTVPGQGVLAACLATAAAIAAVEREMAERGQQITVQAMHIAGLEAERDELRKKADAYDEVDADAEAERAGMEQTLLAAGVPDDPHCGLPSIVDNAVKLIAALEAERDELRKERDARPTLEEVERKLFSLTNWIDGLPGEDGLPEGGYRVWLCNPKGVRDAVRALYAEKAKATEVRDA